MRQLKPSRDIRPVTEFRANAAQFIDQVRETCEPIILTQHGRGVAALIDLETFEAMIEDIELLRDIRTARAQVAGGEVVAHETFMQELRTPGVR